MLFGRANLTCETLPPFLPPGEGSRCPKGQPDATSRTEHLPLGHAGVAGHQPGAPMDRLDRNRPVGVLALLAGCALLLSPAIADAQMQVGRTTGDYGALSNITINAGSTSGAGTVTTAHMFALQDRITDELTAELASLRRRQPDSAAPADEGPAGGPSTRGAITVCGSQAAGR